MFKIIEKAYKWKDKLINRCIETQVDTILLMSSKNNNDTVDSIHKSFQDKGYAGIGFHFIIDKKGNIYRGRQLEYAGCYVQNHNIHTIGICFIGNFNTNRFTKDQLSSGKSLINELKKIKSFMIKTPENVVNSGLIETEGKYFSIKAFCKEEECK